MTGQLTSEMLRVLRIAEREGGAVVAGKGSHAGRVERVNASTILSLIRRGLLSHIYGGEGGLGGRLTETGRAALAQNAENVPAAEHATKKSARQLDAEIATADLMAMLSRNPGATEAGARSYLRSAYGDSTALTEALDAGTAVRIGNKIYRKEDRP